jgi:hypothetical protein
MKGDQKGKNREPWLERFGKPFTREEYEARKKANKPPKKKPSRGMIRWFESMKG